VVGPSGSWKVTDAAASLASSGISAVTCAAARREMVEMLPWRSRQSGGGGGGGVDGRRVGAWGRRDSLRTCEEAPPTSMPPMVPSLTFSIPLRRPAGKGVNGFAGWRPRGASEGTMQKIDAQPTERALCSRYVATRRQSI
jgi:hypothetical protein